MQKVAKEVLDWYKSGKYVASAESIEPDPSNILYLLHLFRQREYILVQTLQSSLARGNQQGASVFQVWMLQEADNVQALAKAFIERFVLEQMLNSISKSDQQIQSALQGVCLLFCLDAIENDMSWFIRSTLVSASLADELVRASKTACSNMAPRALALVDAMGVPEHLLPPAARDWVKYNEVDNQGEMIGIEM